MAYSYDGINWIGLGKTPFTSFGRTITFDGNTWFASGDNSLNFVSSVDGLNWTNITNSLDINYAINIESKKSILFLNSDELIDYGTYFIKPIGYYSNNYNITYSGDYTYILKTNLLVELDSYHKIYDGSLSFDNSIMFSGFKGSDSSFNLLGTINYYTNATPNVGTYIITISGLSALNYNIVKKEGNIYITPAPLIIRADNFTKIYDTSSYEPTYSIFGSNNYSISGTLTLSGTYFNKKDVGTYTIIPSGITSNNYTIKFLNGILQIKPAPLLIIANDDSRIYTNDISNYIFIYNRDNYQIESTNNIQTTNNIKALTNFIIYDRVWTLEGYKSCELKFEQIDNEIMIGLSEVNYKIDNNNYIYYFFYSDNSGNINISENNNISYFNRIGLNNNNIYKIVSDSTSVKYYINNNIIRTTSNNKKLYVNILFKNINSKVYNIQFKNLKEYYYGGNGLTFDGFIGNDNYTCLSGTISYGGTSQGASIEGTYTIIPSGLSSINYNIKYINGYLNIKKSILNSPRLT
jgi:hypothetical protein